MMNERHAVFHSSFIIPHSSLLLLSRRGRVGVPGVNGDLPRAALPLPDDDVLAVVGRGRTARGPRGQSIPADLDGDVAARLDLQRLKTVRLDSCVAYALPEGLDVPPAFEHLAVGRQEFRVVHVQGGDRRGVSAVEGLTELS